MKYSKSNKLYFSSVSLKMFLLTLIVVACFSCKNKEEKVDDMKVEEEVVSSSLETGCYVYNENGNMVNLEITKNDNPVEGTLSYALAEKDKNVGTFKGELNDGRLLGIYTFQSEGLESKRQVAFMLKNNQLTEMYGEMNEDGTMFKDLNTLNFSSKMPLSKTDCEQ